MGSQLRTFEAVILLFLTLLVAGCGGGSSATATSELGPRVRAALVAKAAALEQAGIPKDEAARQLMDWAERTYKEYFPEHQPTQTYAPFVFRYYPSTKVYLGVAIADNQQYPDGVYVMGGEFGDSPLFVGAVTKFIDPTAAPVMAYRSGGFRFLSGRPILEILPTHSGGKPSEWNSEPPLPPGLTLSQVNGAISGSPTGAIGTTLHTITASNAGGASSFRISIEIIRYPTGTGISGRIRGSVFDGVEVALSGHTNAATVTDSSGYYAFGSLQPSIYLVRPQSNLHVFSPNGLEVALGSSSASEQNMLSWPKPMMVDDPIHPLLANPAAGAKKVIPVLMLTYLPTADGVNIDTSRATDFWVLGETSLSSIKNTVTDLSIRGKFMLEEGSKFRGYKNPSSVPFVGYKVVKSITIYGQIPISPRFVNRQVGDYLIRRPDLESIASDFDFRKYVEDHGVKEIWIWFGETAMPGWPSYNPDLHRPENFVEGSESNMSSPTTGDISNSPRIQDLPVYGRTYTVFNYNIRRTQAEFVHNHGHQFEAMFGYVAQRQDGSTDLFHRDFVGWGPNFSRPPLGRAGDTHHPPNTTVDYDYVNNTLVSSDIEDWRPDGSGQKKVINADTWANLSYNWPNLSTPLNQKTESQWYIYWMQNFPGYDNKIPYRNTTMTNWWEFKADWDAAINSNLGLHLAETAPPTVIRLDYQEAVRQGDGSSLVLFAPVLAGDGVVEINGSDSAQPNRPFLFDWGDGIVTEGFFPLRHTYANAQGVYRVTVTARYADNRTDSTQAYVVFGSREITHPQPYPADVAVTIPLQFTALGSTIPSLPAPGNLQALQVSAQLRSTLEYVMSQAARVQWELLEGDIQPTVHGLRQVVYADPAFCCAYSLWFTSPISFAMNPMFVTGSIGYSTLFHEMGHNFTLNTPRAYRYGDHVPGPANAIFTEFVAQVFQHVTAIELVNNRSQYGIPDGIAVDILQSAKTSAQGLRAARDRYVAAGMPFTTWNMPGTQDDEVAGTFLTLAYQFLVHAEQQGNHFAAARRMMAFLRRFGSDWAARYDQHHDTPAAAAFRATLMVAALSHAFRTDLRPEFRALRFTIDDAIWLLLGPETQ